jgi:hypothetical protein
MPHQEYPERESTEPSKIAEPAAGYVISTPTAANLPAAKGRRIAGLEASSEVWEFAQRPRLVPHLETAIRLAQESLGKSQTVYLTYEPDSEIPSLHSIGINARISSDHLEDWERQYRVFQQRFLREIPNEVQHQICLLLWGA